ncbi:hypothetical protein [Ktedonobacter racemifer]|uniref:hypothetical protein n=1 Tax=Ktedonobacter racemifer TaxID=363277 RepID=UPI00146CFD6C|nr:hypothetical protein [Ktedonobacter racemifer]
MIANDEGYGTRVAQRCVEEWLLSGKGSVEALADSLAYVYDCEQPANGPSVQR